MISNNKASYYELDEYLGSEDLYLLLEIITVDNYNRRLANEKPPGHG